MSDFESKRHPFVGGNGNWACKVCGCDAKDDIHIQPREAKAQDGEFAALKALKDSIQSKERTEWEGRVLTPLGILLNAVRAQIVAQPCRCEMGAQGLMRCQRCLLLT